MISGAVAGKFSVVSVVRKDLGGKFSVAGEISVVSVAEEFSMISVANKNPSMISVAVGRKVLRDLRG